MKENEEKKKNTKKVETKKVNTKKVNTKKTNDNRGKKVVKNEPVKEVKKVVKKQPVKEEKVVKEEEVNIEPVVTKVEEKAKKKISVGTIIFLVCVGLFILLMILSSIETSKKEQFLYDIITTDEKSDLDQYISLRDDTNKLHIVVWKQDGCSHCISFQPVLQSVSYKYQVEFNLLNLSKVSEETYYAVREDIVNYSKAYDEDGLGTPSLLIVGNGKIHNILEGEKPEKDLVDELKSLGFIKEEEKGE